MAITNSVVLADNAYGTIASGLSVSDTALVFTTGHGARFPTVAAGQVLYCCLLNSTNVLEEIKVTAHAAGSDSATIVRAANSTAAKAWTAGDRIEARISSEVLRRLQEEALTETTIATADSGATYTGAMSPAALGYITGAIYPLTLTTTNSVTAPTIALNSLAAVTVKLDGGSALWVGAMPLNGLYKHDGTNFILLNPKPKQPTIQVFTSGSGTYTTPAGATRIEVEIVGAGAGGAGSGSAPGAAGDGGSSTFSTITAGGGTKASTATGGAAGTASGGDINLPGQAGFTASTGTANQPGGSGGATKFGGGGFGGNFSSATAGAAPAANTGAGGGGAGNGSVASPGGGGGSGAWSFKVIASPAATYSYAVGAAGAAGTAGGTGDNGAAGAAGIIIVREFYN